MRDAEVVVAAVVVRVMLEEVVVEEPAGLRRGARSRR